MIFAVALAPGFVRSPHRHKVVLTVFDIIKGDLRVQVSVRMVNAEGIFVCPFQCVAQIVGPVGIGGPTGIVDVSAYRGLPGDRQTIVCINAVRATITTGMVQVVNRRVVA